MSEDNKKKPWWLEYVGAAGVIVAFVALLWNGLNTRQQLALTRQTMTLAQRPLLTIRPPTITWTDQIPVITFTWKNSGSGPAQDAKIYSWLSVPLEQGANLDQVVDHGLSLTAIDFRTGPLGPGEEAMSVQSVLPIGEVTGYEGKNPIILVGRAIYWDVFGGEHFTQYCLQFYRDTIAFCERGSTSDPPRLE